MENQSSPDAPSQYAVSLDTATSSITAFHQQFPEFPTKAFTIHADDFLGALGYTPDQIQAIYASNPLPYDHARMYLGLNNDTADLSAKLFLVPVDGASIDPSADINPGTDIILEGNYQGDSPASLASGQYVFDLIAPCPSVCDTGSPLYLASQQQ